MGDGDGGGRGGGAPGGCGGGDGGGRNGGGTEQTTRRGRSKSSSAGKVKVKKWDGSLEVWKVSELVSLPT